MENWIYVCQKGGMSNETEEVTISRIVNCSSRLFLLCDKIPVHRKQNAVHNDSFPSQLPWQCTKRIFCRAGVKGGHEFIQSLCNKTLTSTMNIYFRKHMRLTPGCGF